MKVHVIYVMRDLPTGTTTESVRLAQTKYTQRLKEHLPQDVTFSTYSGSARASHILRRANQHEYTTLIVVLDTNPAEQGSTFHYATLLKDMQNYVDETQQVHLLVTSPSIDPTKYSVSLADQEEQLNPYATQAASSPVLGVHASLGGIVTGVSAVLTSIGYYEPTPSDCQPLCTSYEELKKGMIFLVRDGSGHLYLKVGKRKALSLESLDGAVKIFPGYEVIEIFVGELSEAQKNLVSNRLAKAWARQKKRLKALRDAWGTK